MTYTSDDSDTRREDDTRPHRERRAQDSNGSAPDDGAGGGMGVLMGVAAASFAAGIAANMARKMAVQAPAAMHGDWIAALTAEHRIIEGLFDQLLQTRSADKSRRMALLKSLKGALAKHAFEEENVIYPSLRLHHSESEARHLFAEHADVKTFLMRLEATPSRSPEWLVTVQTLRAMLVKHMREEEIHIFPSLRSRLLAHDNARLSMMTQKEALKLA